MSEAVKWRLVPALASPEMVAATAPLTDAPLDCYPIAHAAMELLPPNEHPDISDILAGIVHDYQLMLAAAPPPPESLVEEWARVIDPEAFEQAQWPEDIVNYDGGGNPVTGVQVRSDGERLVKGALSKANTLLATVTGGER